MRDKNEGGRMDTARLKAPISFKEIQQILRNLNIEFWVIGPDLRCNKLCSIKNVEAKGLYYITSAVNLKGIEIKESIIITDRIIESMADSNSFIIVDDPIVTFYKVSQLLIATEVVRGVHDSAMIHPEARIGEGVTIGAYSIIGNCEISQGANIHPHVVLYDNSIIGKNVTIESGTCIGATGLAWAWDENGNRIMQPQIGGVLIEENCFIGTNISIARGSLNEFTYIGKNTVMAHGTKIGHGARIDEFCHFANNVSVAGSVRIGERCFLGSGSVISSNVRLCPGTIVGAGAVVTKDVDEDDIIVAGVPARKIGSALGTHRGVPWNRKQ